jgi:hypothetical protein
LFDDATTVIIKTICFTPTPYASRHACSRIDAATLFWTVVKIAQALKDFHGEGY